MTDHPLSGRPLTGHPPSGHPPSGHPLSGQLPTGHQPTGHRHLVLVGGGHAHVHVLKRLAERPAPGVRITLVTREAETPYSGMLPGLIAGQYRHAEAHIDLRPLARRAGADLVLQPATALDPTARQLRLADGRTVLYDLLSLDIGSTPRTDIASGALAHTVPLKPVSGLSQRWAAVLDRARSTDRPLTIAMVGGGAAGIEVILGVEARFRRLQQENGVPRPSLSLITGRALLPAHPAAARRFLRREAERRGITLHEHTRIARVEPDRLIAGDGRSFPMDIALWATQAGAAPWVRESGLSVDDAGFLRVGDTLQSVDDPRVFAAGDIATMVNHPRPKAGVFAVRQGPPLAVNLRRVLGGQAPMLWRPQREILALIGTGDGRAVATRNGVALHGTVFWWLKDRIDRQWMAKYQEPDSRPPAPA